MREYNGPLPPEPPAPAPQPSRRKGWQELDEDPPCSECGELLIAPFTTKVTMGGKEKIFLGKIQCRTGCLQSSS